MGRRPNRLENVLGVIEINVAEHGNAEEAHRLLSMDDCDNAGFSLALNARKLPFDFGAALTARQRRNEEEKNEDEEEWQCAEEIFHRVPLTLSRVSAASAFDSCGDHPRRSHLDPITSIARRAPRRPPSREVWPNFWIASSPTRRSARRSHRKVAQEQRFAAARRLDPGDFAGKFA
jgi:hypothetical protein